MREPLRLLLAVPFLILLFASAQEPKRGAIHPTDPFPGDVIGNIERSSFREPSGIVFHPARKTLFVVGDEGAHGTTLCGAGRHHR